MGLLEKAGDIKADEPKVEKKVKKSPPKAEPEPVATPAPVKKKEKKPKRAKKTRQKKERVRKEIPEGFEEAGRARSFGKWLIDLTVNWGLFIGVIALFSQVDGDFTYPLIAILILAVGNIIGMPIWTGRTIGNWISMTSYVNSRGNPPNVIFHILKNTNIPFILLGLIACLIAISSGTVWTTSTKVFVILSLLLLFIPIGDRVVRRFHAQNFGLWEFAFGGVWLVKSKKSEGSSNALLQRLESLSDYSESKGWMQDKDSE